MFNIAFSTQPLNINVGVEGLKLESLAELLFVLASTDRLQVLSCLREEKWYRLTDIAQKLDSSMQEASKHVARLSEQNFIEKIRLMDVIHLPHLVSLLPGSFPQ
jgi:DNA-binding MarR family transcriptional regulator